VGALAAWAAAGLLWWTLLEYLLHRFAFHGGRPLMVSPSNHGRHLRHHARTADRRYAVASWQLAALGAGLHGALFGLAPGGAAGAAMLAGVLCGYVSYEATHWRIHYARAHGRLMRRLQANHLLHHRRANVCFGVTSPLWDAVFGTGADAPLRARYQSSMPSL